ncbi:DUF456 domain-containing protein [Membranihabitans maritimus]|uniref:DUF456 domain-containing protein n=1 Tax=Membranihabitans maritimus TaxID=2904244 RepID=UPI001F31B6B4|nr:DUF456 domain-containing protein [Membranihabitans maritimus]
MEIILVIVAIVLLLGGIAGSFLPVLPGPPLAWVSLLILHFTAYGNFTSQFLTLSFLVMVGIVLLDFFIPMIGTKKFGGSKSGQRGALAGMILGLFGGPLGIIIGPFLGALVGELFFDPRDSSRAMKAAFGSFIGFLIGSGLKLGLCLVFAWYFFSELIG